MRFVADDDLTRRYNENAYAVGQLTAAAQNVHLNVGDAAPDFEVQRTNGERIRLSEFRGKPLQRTPHSGGTNQLRTRSDDDQIPTRPTRAHRHRGLALR